MPQWSLYVRSWGQSGKHMLALSFSGLTPIGHPDFNEAVGYSLTVPGSMGRA
jgi:hypothetical protein